MWSGQDVEAGQRVCVGPHVWECCADADLCREHAPEQSPESFAHWTLVRGVARRDARHTVGAGAQPIEELSDEEMYAFADSRSTKDGWR